MNALWRSKICKTSYIQDTTGHTAKDPIPPLLAQPLSIRQIPHPQEKVKEILG